MSLFLAWDYAGYTARGHSRLSKAKEVYQWQQLVMIFPQTGSGSMTHGHPRSHANGFGKTLVYLGHKP